MAGCAHCLPITYVTFGLGYLAIIGVPPLAGFFSKDPIIETALAAGGFKGFVLGGAALLGAGITAFYMTRVMLMTYFGEKRWAPNLHPHESPRVMTWPMIVLAVGSVFAGGLLAFGGALQRWLEPVVGAHEEGRMRSRCGRPSAPCRSARSPRSPWQSSPWASSSPTGCMAPVRCPPKPRPDRC